MVDWVHKTSIKSWYVLAHKLLVGNHQKNII